MPRHIADSASIGKGCVFGENVVVGENVQIGENAYIGHNVVIHSGTRIGKNIRIGDCCILGRMPSSSVSSHRKALDRLPPLEIGNDCVLCAGVVLYAGVKIGNMVLIGDLASIREWITIGDGTNIGTLVTTSPEVTIGWRVKIQAGAAIAGPSVIEDDVFVSAGVVTTNDRDMGRGKGEHNGFHIKKGARVGANATLLPGVVIGQRAIVAVGAVVTRDVPDQKLVMGVPARVIRDVS